MLSSLLFLLHFANSTYCSPPCEQNRIHPKLPADFTTSPKNNGLIKDQKGAVLFKRLQVGGVVFCILGGASLPIIHLPHIHHKKRHLKSPKACSIAYWLLAKAQILRLLKPQITNSEVSMLSHSIHVWYIYLLIYHKNQP